MKFALVSNSESRVLKLLVNYPSESKLFLTLGHV